MNVSGDDTESVNPLQNKSNVSDTDIKTIKISESLVSWGLSHFLDSEIVGFTHADRNKSQFFFKFLNLFNKFNLCLSTLSTLTALILVGVLLSKRITGFLSFIAASTVLLSFVGFIELLRMGALNVVQQLFDNGSI